MFGFDNYDLASLMKKELKKIAKIRKGFDKTASSIAITDKTSGGISLREFATLENKCYPADPMFPIEEIEEEYDTEIDTKIKDMEESLRIDIADYYLDGDTNTEVSGEPIDEILIFGTNKLYIIALRAGKTIEIADACSERRIGGNASILFYFFKHMIKEIKSGNVNKVVGTAREATSWPILQKMFLYGSKKLLKDFEISINNESVLRPDADVQGQDEAYQEFQVDITSKSLRND